MNTFLVERTIPPRFAAVDADQVALHARWAVGALWSGGVVTEGRMHSPVTAEAETDLRRCQRTLDIADGDIFAMSREDPRFREPLR